MSIEVQFMGLPPDRQTPVLTAPAKPLSADQVAENTARFMRETGMVPGERQQAPLETTGPVRPASPAQVQRFMIANGMV